MTHTTTDREGGPAGDAMSDRTECFPEPSVDDPTPGRNGESRAAWLRRSTWDRAAETREFYNRNLAALPVDIAKRLCRELHADRTLAKHFELVVGRFLQLLGASVEYEVEGVEGRRVDWLGRFDDGTVSVEATLPIANGVVGDTVRASQRIVDLAVRLAPPGWYVMIHRVPQFGPNESLRPLRARLRERYAAVPSPVPDARWTIEEDLDLHGIFGIDLVARPEPSAPAIWGAGPAVGFGDDTSTVVTRAINGKRDQVRGAVRPVLIALCTDGFGSYEVDKFDVALLGHTVWQQWNGDTRFEPDGAFRPTPVGKEPTFAGALVFASLGMRGGPDPILYLHPRYRGVLPAALATLRRRYAGEREVAESPPARDGILDGLGWPRT